MWSTYHRMRSDVVLKQIHILVDWCLQKGYISQEEVPWLQYAFEKRIITLVTFVPLLVLGFSIANSAMVIGFFAAFYFLRTRTNGYHAKNVGWCLFYSALGEILFLNLIPQHWNKFFLLVALIVSIAIIWLLAPYNHPNMKLSQEEIEACARSSKNRLSILLIVLSLLYICRQWQLAIGILSGIFMVASLLVLAYCV